MRMKPTLSRAELVLLLQLLGAGEDSPFASLLAKIRTFTVEVSPDGGVLGGGTRYRYRLKFDAVAPLRKRFGIALEIDDIVSITSYASSLEILRRLGVEV